MLRAALDQFGEGNNAGGPDGIREFGHAVRGDFVKRQDESTGKAC
jgi:hypothetical protein